MTKKIIFIIFSIIIAFLIMRFLSSFIFLANTPKINPNWREKFYSLYIDPAKQYLASKTNSKMVVTSPSPSKIKFEPEKEITRGIFMREAKAGENNIIIRVDENRMNLIATTITTKKGKVITIWHSKDKNISQELIDLLVND